MLRTRVIPCLLLDDGALVKSVRFADLDYIGDPINAVRIYNELEVDELIFLDISASVSGREPAFEVVHQIADECFMPLSYGGGIRTIDDARRLFGLGVEKVTVNTATFDAPHVVAEIAAEFGNQAVIASVDVKKTRFGGHRVFRDRGTVNTKVDPAAHSRAVVQAGAGEILLTSIDRDGTWEGYDTDLVRGVADAVDVPVIASGGAGSVADFAAAKAAGASALAAGSMVVYQRQGLGVLISFPKREDLDAALG